MNRPLEVGMTGQRKQSMINDNIVDLGSAWSSRKTNEILQMANRLYEGKDLEVHFAEEIDAFDGNVWAWVQARIRAGDFQSINVGDFIRFTAGGHIIEAEIAGINTYTRSMSPEVGSHIDFISRDLWPEPVVWNLANYNNGVAAMTTPFLTSNVHAFINSLQMDVPNGTTANPAMLNVDYRNSGILSRLPAELREVLVPKIALMERRFSAGLLLVDSNSWDWREMGLLWLPTEIEIYGHPAWGTIDAPNQGVAIGSYVHYPLFTNNMKRVKGNGHIGVRHWYWLATVRGGFSTHVAAINHGGNAHHATAGDAMGRVPVCFRIA